MSSPRILQSLTGALAIALTAAIPQRLGAQSATERAELERFRDSIATTSDTIGLLALEQRLIEVARTDRTNALLHLKLGFLSLRLGDLGGHSHYDDAASEFQRAIDLQPGWPYSWYGMGLAEYGVGGSSRVSFADDAFTRSAAAFAKSAAVDPSFRLGLVEVGRALRHQALERARGSSR